MLGVMRAGIRAFLAEHGVPRRVVDEIVLSVHEAAMNGLRSGGGVVDIQVQVGSARVIASVEDHGPGFSYSRPEWPDALATTGRGLCIIRSLMDRVEVGCTTSTRVLVEKRLRRPD